MTVNHLQVAAALTRLASTLSARRDIVVRCDEPIEHRGQFRASTAQISIDLNTAASAHDRERLATDPNAAASCRELLGVLIHELSHADHTHMHEMTADVAAWAALLEEPRVEYQALATYPQYRTQVSAAASTVVKEPAAGNPIAAIETLILLGGRVHAGVFTARQADRVCTIARTALTVEDAAEVEGIVAAAVRTADGDRTTMAGLASRVLEIADHYGGGAPSASDHWGAIDDTDASEDEKFDDSDVEQEPGSGERPPEGRFLKSMLGPNTVKQWLSVTTLADTERTLRSPTDAELTRCWKIGSWISGERQPAPSEQTSQHPAPPGRLRMAELMRAQAQQELGQPVTATPWTRRRTRVGPTTPLEVGVFVDRSQSMTPHMEPMAVAAWTLRQALTGHGVGRSHMWVFNSVANTVPTRESDTITIPQATGNTTALLPALLDYQRWTSHEQAAKVAAIVSDGDLHGDPVLPELERLARQGVRIIGIAPSAKHRPLLAGHLPAGAHVTVMGADPVSQLSALV